MKKLALLLSIFFSLSVYSQQSYWQQQADYNIDVILDDSLHSLNASMELTYHNNSPDTLDYIWFHLWPNAYKNDRTAFSEQLLSQGRTDFYFSEERSRGYINRLNFSVNGVLAKTEDHPVHQDIIKLYLPQKLLPERSVQVKTPFHVKLPANFSRSGHIGKSYQVTQWFPKAAMYDKKGWHLLPYLDYGEYYSNFGNYRVAVTVPKEYKVASTGKSSNEVSSEDLTTHTFIQNNVHDFAWFADKNFAMLHDTIQLPSGIIDAYAYFNSANQEKWKNSIQFIKRAIRTKSEWLGDYPYQTVTVVEKPGGNDGGMEYPTITLVSPQNNDKELDLLINHEIGHNWFYGILATNERLHPWMDEGMNSYYDEKYSKMFYTDSSVKKTFFSRRLPLNIESTALAHIEATRQDQPIETTSENFNQVTYSLIPYIKAANWLKLLEKEAGKENFERLMKAYYERWKFRHPYPEDFKKVAEEVSGKDMTAVFNLLHKTGPLEKAGRKKLKPAFGFNLSETDKYHYISFFPAAGYNMYDKFMAGLLVHNYSLPAPKFRLFLAPLYATGTKQLNGIGRLAYNFYPAQRTNIEISISASKFTANTFTDSAGVTSPLTFSKIVPAVKFTFGREATSTANNYLQFKSFNIRETKLSFYRDTSLQQDIITFPEQSFYINQLQFVLSNDRKLYPYKILFQGEQGDGFVRATIESKYLLNYPKGGGLSVRFFAGKFFYTGERTFLKQFQTDRFHLNLTGPRGYEDYTYSDYFFGRNEFEGFASQQLMIRDGAFKVGTDLLSSKVGKTDDWLSALNLNTTIPDNLNPLSFLPVKIPLRIFADIGTYSEAWKKESPTGKFLFDAGLQLSLLNIVNIYIPVLYSKVYRDYYASTITEKKFSKTISFSIDLDNIKLNRMIPQINY